MKRKTHKTTVQ